MTVALPMRESEAKNFPDFLHLVRHADSRTSHEPLKGAVENRRFHAGVFIGIDRRTGQYILHDGSEVKLARTIMRMLGVEK